MHSLTFAGHDAHLCPMTGEGLLVRPLPERDAPNPLGGSAGLHAVEWNAVMRHLDGLGWELSEGDEDGLPSVVGHTADGREVVGLSGREPVVTMPTMGEQAQALDVLLDLAGVVRCSRQCCR